jgi:hypothetical protein
LQQKLLKYMLFFEALVYSVFAGLCVALLPMKRYLFLLGNNITQLPDTSPNTLNNYNMALLKEIRYTMDRLVKYLPWKTKCLTQAITGRLMLKLRNIDSTIHLGVRNNEGELKAHAWLEVQNYVVTGRKGLRNYRIVQSFC